MNGFSAELPEKYSRKKALDYLRDQKDVRGGQVMPVPHKTDRADLYKLYMKIGAISELPENPQQEDSYLNDMWRTMYLRNHLCPADIPFDLIMDEFTLAMVQGTIKRKGNNQAAIVSAFNNWITRPDVRHRLYQVRDQMYPDNRPKQLAKDATPETVADYTDEELQQKLASIKPMAGLLMVDQMIEELEAEMERRRE